MNLIQKWNTSPNTHKIWIAVAAVSLVTLITFWTQFDSDPSNEEDSHIPAIFNFGDSNSDTGGYSAAFGRIGLPNGRTFFGRPSGRFSDRRLIIDFIAERLRVPYLNAYLDSFKLDFKHGANFAQGGSTIQPLNGILFKEGFNPFSLNLQVLQFEDFKARVMELYGQGKWLGMESRFPYPDDFARALYTIDSGQNDLHAAVTLMTVEKAKASIPGIINHFATNIERLYELGARTFWIHNTGPIGCLPYFVIKYPPMPTDAVGCIYSYNEIAKEFNKQLMEKIILLRSRLVDAVLNYVDMYAAKYSLIKTAKAQGFVDPLGFCYNNHEDDPQNAENSMSCCDDPSTYISWDSIHYTEAANKWVSDNILNGSIFNPSVPIS